MLAGNAWREPVVHRQRVDVAHVGQVETVRVSVAEIVVVPDVQLGGQVGVSPREWMNSWSMAMSRYPGAVGEAPKVLELQVGEPGGSPLRYMALTTP